MMGPTDDQSTRLKKTVKDFLGELPLTAEVYWLLRNPGKPLTKKFSLHLMKPALPEWRSDVEASPLFAGGKGLGVRRRRKGSGRKKKIVLFGMLRYWIEHVTLLGFALAGLGHEVSVLYLPYGIWFQPTSRFDLRRQNLYAHSILNKAAPTIRIESLMDMKVSEEPLPGGLQQALRGLAYLDTQYTLQSEDVDMKSELYNLRLDRNMQAAHTSYDWLKKERPDLVIVPNGTVLEFGAVYQVARELELPTVTYEFGEQRGRVWLAQDAEVMRQETGSIWEARQSQPLTAEQQGLIRQFYTNRQSAKVWSNLIYSLQGADSAGGERVRQILKLDHRPVALLATNVVGDSLTLSRQVFSASMSDWVVRTMRHFMPRQDVQLVVRVHPGELLVSGPSVADYVKEALGGEELPEHIHLVAADAQVNTYDIVEIADLGLVYTTTTGLDMVMSGLPVIPVGSTHYRGKGFTLDVETWREYFEMLDKVLANPGSYRPTPEQVEHAWNYAYRFFFEYAQPYPWHLATMWPDLKEWPIRRVLSDEGQEKFGNTFRYLSGEPISW